MHTQPKESNDSSDVDDVEYIDGVEDAADLLELYFCLPVCLQVISFKKLTDAPGSEKIFHVRNKLGATDKFSGRPNFLKTWRYSVSTVSRAIINKIK